MTAKFDGTDTIDEIMAELLRLAPIADASDRLMFDDSDDPRADARILFAHWGRPDPTDEECDHLAALTREKSIEEGAVRCEN